MLASEHDEVREAGGQMIAWLALRKVDEPLLKLLSSPDRSTRKGIPRIAARFVAQDPNLMSRVLVTLFEDDDDEVRAEAASVVTGLRGAPLRPYRQLLEKLIDSSAFAAAERHMLVTLDHAPDQVDLLVLGFVRRFMALHGHELGTFVTRAAGDAQKITNLLVRLYTQTQDARLRTETLDHVDILLEQNAY